MNLLNQAPAHEMPIAAFYIFSIKRSDEHLDPDGKPTLFGVVELANSLEDAETILDSMMRIFQIISMSSKHAPKFKPIWHQSQLEGSWRNE
jgi:hypothetical protein